MWEREDLVLSKCRTSKLLFPNRWKYLAPLRKPWDVASCPSLQPLAVPLDRMALAQVLMPYAQWLLPSSLQPCFNLPHASLS